MGSSLIRLPCTDDRPPTFRRASTDTRIILCAKRHVEIVSLICATCTQTAWHDIKARGPSAGLILFSARISTCNPRFVQTFTGLSGACASMIGRVRGREVGGYIRPDAGDEARLAVAADGVLEQVRQLGGAVGHVLAALLG